MGDHAMKVLFVFLCTAVLSSFSAFAESPGDINWGKPQQSLPSRRNRLHRE